MIEKSERFMDRTGWAAGPWDDEPDRVEWRSGDLPCLIVRGPMGALCGYVGVSPGHPWRGRGLYSIEVAVHGGLTYASECSGRICHVPQPGESDDVFWLGFDCGHAFDTMPGLEARTRAAGFEHPPFGTYRDLAYVRAEVEKLAKQAREAA